MQCCRLQGFGWLTPTVGALEFMQCLTQALSTNVRKSMQQSQKVCLTRFSTHHARFDAAHLCMVLCLLLYLAFGHRSFVALHG